MPFNTSSPGPLPLPPQLRDGGMSEEGGMPSGAESAQMDNLLKLVYQVEKALNTIARAYPQVASKIDVVKESLTDVVATATRKGASKAEKRGLSGMKGMDL